MAPLRNFSVGLQIYILNIADYACRSNLASALDLKFLRNHLFLTFCGFIIINGFLKGQYSDEVAFHKYA